MARVRGANRPALVLGLVAGAVVTAAWAAPTLESFDYGIRGFDSLWYHLPFAASFAQTGQIVSLRFGDVEYLSQFYPATSELLHAIGLVLLGRDTLSPALNMFWLVADAARRLLHRAAPRARSPDRRRRRARLRDRDDGLLAGGRRRERHRRRVLPARRGRAVGERRGVPRGVRARRRRRRPGGRHEAQPARAGGGADRRCDRAFAGGPAPRRRRDVARAARARRRLLVSAQSDRRRQPAAVDELRRDPADAGAAAPTEHGLLARALPDGHARVDPPVRAGTRRRTRPLVAARARGHHRRPAAVPGCGRAPIARRARSARSRSPRWSVT